MPTFLLYLKAELENISKLEVPEGGRFCIDVSDTSSTAAARRQPTPSSRVAAVSPTQVKESAGSESRERVYVSSTDEHDLSGSKGKANFVSAPRHTQQQTPSSVCSVPSQQLTRGQRRTIDTTPLLFSPVRR